VYDTTKKESFDHLQHWIEQADGHASGNCEKFLIANKVDLRDIRLISEK
tara:strand:- start:272 stop:418 length:147 start_codon:yes stop_codon:yes gene_type:complete